ncbi:MAG: hypothetical protein RL367_2603 [Pseudomonadota bacterium]|jgi:2-polyprenyl-3-methyl-5-hydroxy-6-metoxy-1,4-benzoquinol methylase
MVIKSACGKSGMEQTVASATPKPLGYDGYSDWKNWDSFFQFSPDDASYFEQEVPRLDLRQKRLLEIGFGEGRFLAWARAQGAEIEGMELDPRAVAAAVEAGITVITTDIADHAANNGGRYTLVAALDVFEHLTIDQISDYLAATSGLLEPDGVLILRYPNGQSPFGLPQQHGDVTHITALSRAKIEQLAARHGFVTERYAGSAVPRGTGLVRIVRWSRKLARKAIGRVLNFVFGQDIVWDAVVTHVLRKR